MLKSLNRILVSALAIGIAVWAAAGLVSDHSDMGSTPKPDYVLLIQLGCLYVAYICVLFAIDIAPKEADSE